MRRLLCASIILAAMGEVAGLPYAFAQDDAVKESQRWIHAKFQRVVDTPPATAFLKSDLKSGMLLRDRIDGRPLKIEQQKFDRGLAMRSPGRIDVEVPAGIRNFEAFVGIDSNDLPVYSHPTRGSVRVFVERNGKQMYASPAISEGMGAVPVKIDLQGARAISLVLAPTAIRSPRYPAEWDQADWANARLTFVDGTQAWLSDLPIGSPFQVFTTAAPFSFVYGGVGSAELLGRWPVETTTRQIDETRTEYTSRWKDSATGLEVRCVAVAYKQFPIVEWTIYFKNNGLERTPILENLEAIDTELQGSAYGSIVVHHEEGSSNKATDFRPLDDGLARATSKRFGSIGGRPSDGDMPFFDLDFSGRGVITALGWPGQWHMDISRNDSTGVHLVGGQDRTHFWLAPGEEVRTPLAVLQFWDGDWIDGQNVWRRWMLASNLPRPGGHLVAPVLSGGSNDYTRVMMEGSEQNQIEFLKDDLDDGIPLQYWWMDAGWYPFETSWRETGTWQPDAARFPHGIRAVSDFAHAHGVQLILWFEPERVAAGSWLALHHPEWLLGTEGHDRLLFLGNQQAWTWLVERVGQIIRDEGVDVYRQDFNFQPLALWRTHDAPDRQGMTEIQHVEGYLRFLDELQRRFPKLLLDTCASGGRRLDLETLRRAVPLWRSDFAFHPGAMQMQTFGLSLWVPYHGTAIDSVDPYVFRSQMTPALGVSPNPVYVAENKKPLLELLAQWRQVNGFYFDDFYPLLPYSTSESAWMAWQFNRPDGRAGMIQAFRRAESSFTSAALKLRGLNPHERYSVKDIDSGKTTEYTGKELMEGGVSVSISQAAGSKVLLYTAE